MTETKKPLTARDINHMAQDAMEGGGMDWYMGYCPPMKEFKAQASLFERGFLSYQLLKTVTRNRAGMRMAPKHKRTIKVDSPTLSGTLFFAMDRNRPQWLALRKRPQVLTSIMCYEGTGQPALISARELLRMIETHDKKPQPLKRGDLVRTQGAYPLEASILAVEGKVVKLDIEMLGRHVEIPLDKVRKIA